MGQYAVMSIELWDARDWERMACFFPSRDWKVFRVSPYILVGPDKCAIEKFKALKDAAIEFAIGLAHLTCVSEVLRCSKFVRQLARHALVGQHNRVTAHRVARVRAFELLRSTKATRLTRGSRAA